MVGRFQYEYIKAFAVLSIINYQFQAQSNLETLYSRFLRDKVGWKKASHRYLNQKYLLAQLHECMLIYTMENLQIDELSNSNKNNPLEAMT